MPRLPSFYLWKNRYFVTESGGQGIHILCNKEDGEKEATSKLADWVKKNKKEKDDAKRAGLVDIDSPYTVAQLAAEFLQFKEVTKKASTFEFYRKSLQKFVRWYGNLQARKLCFSHGTDFISKLQAAKLGNISINHNVRSAKSVLNYGIETDRLVKNVWKKIPELPEFERKRIATDEEFQALLTACDKCISYRGKNSKADNADTMRDILHILRFTGLRPGELRKLRWDHIFLEEGLIIIPASEQKTGTTAKVPEDRMIPILEEAKAIFVRRKEKYGHQPMVFQNALGKDWTDQLFSQRFARLRKRAGLNSADQNNEKLVPYSLRHSRLTEAGTKEGWDFFTLMKLAGHTTTQMTKRYVHPGKDDLLRAARDGQQKRMDAKGVLSGEANGADK